MLPKGRRLRRREQFDRVFKHGRAISEPGFRILYSPGDGKAAVVVAKSAGSIAYRNTIKRRWREALASLIDLIPNTTDIVVVVKPEGAKARGEKLRLALEAGMRKLPSPPLALSEGEGGVSL